MELTPCIGKLNFFFFFFMESLMGIFLKENWQISVLLQLNLLMNKKTNKLMADEKTKIT